jgi:hypothetical protein
MALSSPKIPDLKKVNWRKVAAMANPESIKDLDTFLDKLPQRAGMNGIIAASIIWGIAGVAVLFAYTKSVNLQELRREMTQAEAMRPTVPTITYAAVSPEQIKNQIEKIKTLYKNITIEAQGDTVKITAVMTRDFPVWRAAIGDLGYGNSGWRVQVKEMCAGRDCEGGSLKAVLSVQQLNINIPDAKS